MFGRSFFIIMILRNCRVMQKENGESFSTFSVSVPRAGVEPAQVSLLVFETSASTDSAIWAHTLETIRFRFAVQR